MCFLREHPWNARSWKETEMRKLLGMPGVVRIRGDMCEFEMTQQDGTGVGIIKKATGLGLLL